VVEAIRTTQGLDRNRLVHQARDRILIFRAGQREIGVHSEALQALPHDVLEERARSIAAHGVGIKDPYRSSTDRARMTLGQQLLSALSENATAQDSSRRRFQIHGLRPHIRLTRIAAYP
jgi:hypothetical protein